MSARRALITGITGQDGSYLAELLLADGCEVVGLVRSPAAGDHPNLLEVRGRVELLRGDLLRAETLRAAVAQVQPDELYHLAAPTTVTASFDEPAMTRAAIVDATDALLGALAEHRPRARAFVATSSEIFGDADESPQSETSRKRPRNPYGEAKLAAHELVAQWRERGLFAVSGIAYNHESPRRPQSFLPRKVARGAAAIALGIEDGLTLGDLRAVRDWSDARDIVRAATLALRADSADDYVLASGQGRTVGELVQTAFAAAGIDVDERVAVDPALVRPPEPTPLVGDPRHALEALGWRCEIPFERTIGEMVAADLERLRG